MALLFCDSFDGYDVEGDLDSKWDMVPGNNEVSFNTNWGRWGGGSSNIEGNADQGLTRYLPASISTAIAGASIKVFVTPNAQCELIGFKNTANTDFQCCLVVNSGGAITARLGAWNDYNDLGTSATGVIKVGVWQHIEVKAYIHDTAGTIEVRVDEVVVLNLTSQDTRHTAGDDYIGAIEFTSAISSSGETGWDDIVIMDTTGSYNNDFIGDCRIHSVLPDANGSTNNFTPLSGSNWEMVDDKVDDDASYVYSTTSGHQDLYSFGTAGLTSDHTIAAVCVSNLTRKDDIGSRTVASVIRSSATNGTGGNVSLDNLYQSVFAAFDLDPGTASVWNGTSVDSIEAGIEITG